MTDYAVRAMSLSKRFDLGKRVKSGVKERIVTRSNPMVQSVRQERIFWALKDATFDVERGTSFGIIGHNGSGKSTALKVLSGIYRPTEGVVEVNGRASSMLELGAGFHPDLTGRENIVLNGSILGLTRREIEAAMDDIIDFAGIEGFVDTPVKYYSSGMYVRLGFSVAVKVRPEILMVDEIIAVGDEEFQRKCFSYLHDLRRNGATIMIVSHSMEIIQDLCHNAVWLDHGRVRALGDSRTVVKQYINSVNQAEAGALGPTQMQTGAVRVGTGEVKITKVEFLDGAHAPGSLLIGDESGTIRLHYQADEPVDEASFGIDIYNDVGICIVASNSDSAGRVSIPPGRGHVDFVMPRVLLKQGDYELSTSVGGQRHFFDLLTRAFQFRVRDSHPAHGGVVRVEGSWSLSLEGRR